MKILVVGMPKSGRTTVAKAIANDSNNQYLDAVSWAKSSFREPKEGEKPQQYDDEYHQWLINIIKKHPDMCIEMISSQMMGLSHLSNNFVIDGIFSPRDFIKLFDINKDIVIFLNRTNDSEIEYKDYENIGIPVMRDFCFWLASAELLDKKRWLEFNFAIPGDKSDALRTLGHKNSVYLVKNINKVIQIIKDLI